jgi:hypothetical protein
MQEQDTERTTVKTYVPRAQKEVWNDHAADLDMSQSEFVRTMVQAGRRGFDPVEEGGSDPSDPRGNDLETRVRDVLSDEAVHSWDELREALVADLDERLEAALETLQTEGDVVYSGRHGGYRVVGDE